MTYAVAMALILALRGLVDREPEGKKSRILEQGWPKLQLKHVLV